MKVRLNLFWVPNASLKCCHANYFLQKGVQVKTQKSHWCLKWTPNIFVHFPLFSFHSPFFFLSFFKSCWFWYLYVCVLCSWNQTQLSTFGKETSSNTRMRWQRLRYQGTRPCYPLPGTWTVSPTARTGRAITRPTHRISRVCLHGWFTFPVGTGPLPFMQHGLFSVFSSLIWYCFIVLSLVGLRLYYLYWLLTQIWNVMKMFVTPVQICVSLLNEQRENSLII